MRDRKRRIWTIILMFGIVCLPSAGQSVKGSAPDYAQVRTSILKFEETLNTTVNGAFGQNAVIGKVKGVYLPGYGYSFGFLVNTRWGLINTPMGKFSSGADPNPEQKTKRIQELIDQLMLMMFTRGGGVRPLERDKSLTITASFEETNPEGTVNRTIVMSVLKSDLDEFGSRMERYNEFKQRVKIVEY
jgi:hypothetical protein